MSGDCLIISFKEEEISSNSQIPFKNCLSYSSLCSQFMKAVCWCQKERKVKRNVIFVLGELNQLSLGTNSQSMEYDSAFINRLLLVIRLMVEYPNRNSHHFKVIGVCNGMVNLLHPTIHELFPTSTSATNHFQLLLPDESNRLEFFSQNLSDFEEVKYELERTDDKIEQLVNGSKGFSYHDLINIYHLIKVSTSSSPFLLSSYQPESFRSVTSEYFSSSSFPSSNQKEEEEEIVIGQLEAKMKLEETILWRLNSPHLFQRMGIQPPSSLLLYGPPGCSKTSLVRSTLLSPSLRSSNPNLSFISLSAADVYSPYLGEAEEKIRNAFESARKNAPCVLFIDEIDSLVSNRSTSSSSRGEDAESRVLATFLTEMDGIQSYESRYNIQDGER